MVLGDSKDATYLLLKERYGVIGQGLAEDLKVIETHQPGKPLQVFPNPVSEKGYWITINFPEVTSLCPKTGQPDFANFKIEYMPDKVCIELKALKLYFHSYRDEGHFFEELTNLVYEDLEKVLDPISLYITAKFSIRGGMEVVVERGGPEEKDE